LWFIVAAIAVMSLWITTGLPDAACSLPLVSGVRYGRHLLPHVQMLFIIAVGVASQRLSEAIDGRWPWIVFGGAFMVSAWMAVGTEPVFMRARVVGCSIAGLALGVCAALRRSSGTKSSAQRAAYASGLMLFALAPYFFGSPMSALILQGRAGSRQIAPLPTEIDGSTPLGIMQRVSEAEDRRHYSPMVYLYPNWSAAIRVLDMLSLNAFYPVGYYELNAGLFKHWNGDPSHGIVPDRFTAVWPPSASMSTEFQRVLVLNRVSLFTFTAGQAFFAEPGSPYEQSKCRLLGRSSMQTTETWVCPMVGGVGYFPETVTTVQSRAEGTKILGSAPPSDLLKIAVLGPELDLSIGNGVPAAAGAASGGVTSVDRRGDDLKYVLDVKRGGMFVIADSYFRGWTATVNGQPAGISRANVAFKAVRVPRGSVELKLHFSPAL
jgi:hypothetical protein